MTYASLALVIVLGTATLLTNDPRFVLVKPSIAHFAIGAIMLKARLDAALHARHRERERA